MTRLLLVAAILVVVLAAAGVGAGAELHVYPGEGTPIQDAVDGAGAGDTIYVHAGTYVENVDVDKRVTLIGDGADVVTVWAADAGDHVLEVTADWVNISGFTVTGATSEFKVGIYLYNANHCNISNNNALNNDYGIRPLSSNSNMLQNNNASNNNYGICLDISSDNTLKGNTMFGNTHNFGVNGGLYGYTQNIDTSNTVDGKPIYYWVDQHDRQIPADAGFVAVVNSKNITVKDLTLTKNYKGVLFACTENSRIENVTTSNNAYGIHLWYSSNNTLQNNTASNNAYGIVLSDSSNNTLTSNTVNSNFWIGIWLVYSSNNTLQNNTVSNNRNGIHLYSLSSNNTIYHNSLINNTSSNAYDTDTNQWDFGSEGNYHSDYTGNDTNRDGIGDTSYDIPGGTSVDRYPLMQPWGSDTPQKGDLNSDGYITPADAAIALQLAATGAHNDAADVSGDGRVTSLDALMILQVAAENMEL